MFVVVLRETRKDLSPVTHHCYCTDTQTVWGAVDRAMVARMSKGGTGWIEDTESVEIIAFALNAVLTPRDLVPATLVYRDTLRPSEKPLERWK